MPHEQDEINQSLDCEAYLDAREREKIARLMKPAYVAPVREPVIVHRGLRDVEYEIVFDGR